MIPPYLKRDLVKDTGRAGRKAESSLAHRMGVNALPGSGSLKGAKGDIVKEDFLIENKSSTKDSFSIKKDHLYKIYQEALDTNKQPALAFQFVNSQGQSQKKDRWVCIPESVWKEWL